MVSKSAGAPDAFTSSGVTSRPSPMSKKTGTRKSAVAATGKDSSKAPTKKKLVDELAEERRRVDYDSYDISVQQLLTMVINNQIDVAPTYQRRFRWDEGRQSQLIES